MLIDFSASVRIPMQAILVPDPRRDGIPRPQSHFHDAALANYDSTADVDGARKDFLDQAFQTLPGGSSTAAMAFRVSTMHCAQVASS